LWALSGFGLWLRFGRVTGRGRPSSILETSLSLVDLTQATAGPDLLSKPAPLDRPRDEKVLVWRLRKHSPALIATARQQAATGNRSQLKARLWGRNAKLAP